MLHVVNAIAYRGTPSTDPETEEKVWLLEAGSAWDTASENVIKFVQESNKKIMGSGKEYTTFKKTPSNRDFPKLLGGYLSESQTFEHFHSTFTQSRLTSNLKNSRLEDGAIIVFVHFKLLEDPQIIIQPEGDTTPVEPVDPSTLEVNSNQFLVLMVKNTGALKFTDDLQISEIDVIDLRQFVQGCQVDLTRFQNSIINQAESESVEDSNTEEAESTEEETTSSVEADNFLTFIRGGGDVRDYFKDALFAEKSITNKASSENIEKALNDFWSTHKAEIDDRAVRDLINSSVYLFSEEHKKEVVTLEQVSSVVDRCIPDTKAHLRGQFVDFANAGDYEINDEFELNSNIIKELVYVDLDVGFAKLILEKGSIGSSADATDERQVKYNPSTHQVTFTTTIEDPRQIDIINSILENDDD
ncbi:hypothetical protein A9266_24185 [Vibrio tasmaniensis]|nr:hypothetical protein A9266_24185 [Vibrio tasmaniensis]